MLSDLTGKVAVVTGGANGIGRALTWSLAEHGMQVVLADVNQDALDQTCTALADAGHRTLPVAVDVANAQAMDQLAERAWNEFGAVHLLCNNAGIIGPREQFVWDVTPDAWQRVFEVNVLGALHGVQAFVPRMAQLGTDCHIVNTASMMGWIAYAPVAAQYSATKHAVLSMSETLAYEAKQNLPWLGVSVLCPGPVDSGFRQRNQGLGFADTGEADLDESHWQSERDRVTVFPDMVAEEVVAAITKGRFYICPNPGSRARLQSQFEAVLSEVVR